MTTPMDLFAPFDAGAGADVTEAMWRNFMRNLRDDGVIATKSYPPEDPSELRVGADGSGMIVFVEPGECWIQAHWGEVTTTASLPIATADATNPRKDLVVARADFVLNEIVLDVVTGTPAPTPSPPSLTQDTSSWEIPLAVVFVDVDETAITAGDISDDRRRVGLGLFNEFTPYLGTTNGVDPNNENGVDLGDGGKKYCRYHLQGTILHIRYAFIWGTGPYDKPGYSTIYTELPPGLMPTNDEEQWMWAHLWTVEPDGTQRHWSGQATVLPGEPFIYIMFNLNNDDSRINYYRITNHATETGTSSIPHMPNDAYPEGGSLVFSGVLEVQ